MNTCAIFFCYSPHKNNAPSPRSERGHSRVYTKFRTSLCQNCDNIANFSFSMSATFLSRLINSSGNWPTKFFKKYPPAHYLLPYWKSGFFRAIIGRFNFSFENIPFGNAFKLGNVCWYLKVKLVWPHNNYLIYYKHEINWGGNFCT